MAERPLIVGFLAGMAPVLFAYLRDWLWVPEVLTWQDYALLGLCAVVCISNYFNEYLQWFPLQYSKFAPEGGVPARLGWFLMYFSPAVLYLATWYKLGAPSSGYDLMVVGLYTCHFLKRCLEVIFVHKYSKDCLLISVIEIAAFYSLGAVVTSYSCHVLTGDHRLSFLDDSHRVMVGMAVYSLGQLTNFYHHVLLAGLRPAGSFRYVIPTGGLFSLVVCPQYFGELLSWLGFAIAAHCYGAYLCYIPMIVYLCSRAHHTHRWYATKFDNYPGASTQKVWPLIY